MKSTQGRNCYRVTIIFSPSHRMDDIALRSSSMKAAREDVQNKCADRWPDSKPTFSIKPISDKECEEILAGGGIDWATR